MNVPTSQQIDNSIKIVGRFVQGDLYEPNKTDMKGNPLIVQSGPNKGQPRVEYFFKLASPKTQQVWWQEEWGAKILALANTYWPQGQAGSPKFAWKIEDGDDVTPNPERGGRKNSETEGFAGCWVIKFTSGFATKIFDVQGTPMLQPGLVKRGFWIEVHGTVNSNSEATKPGIFINHSMVAYRAPDKEITSGPDPRSAGFGALPLPAGVTAAPMGSANLPAITTPGTMPASAPLAMPTSTPGVPGGYPPPAPAGGYVPSPGAMPAASMPAAPTPTPMAVQPNPGFIAPPVAAGVPMAPQAPAALPVAVADPLGAPVGFRMANPAGGRYDAFRANGWTDASMIASGHMVRL